LCGEEITPPHIEIVDAELACGDIEHALAKQATLEAAGTAIGAGWCLVGEDTVTCEVEVRNPIRYRSELSDIAHRRHAVGPDIGADIDMHGAAHRGHGAVALAGDLNLGIHLPRVADGGEMLAPVLDPFDRMTEFACGEGDQEILRIEFAARAKAAADVKLDIVDGGLRQAHHSGHGAAIEERQFRRATDGEAIVARMPFREQAACLHRQRGMTLHGEAFAAGIGGHGEGGRGIAALRGEGRGDVGRGFGEQQIRPGH